MVTETKASPEAADKASPAAGAPATPPAPVTEPKSAPTEPAKAPPEGYVPIKDLDELKTALGRQSNEVGDLRRQLAEREALANHWQTTAQQLGGLVKEKEDPEIRAYNNYQRVIADNPYDAAAIAEAQRVWLDERDVKRDRRTLEASMRAQQIQSDLPNAARMLGLQDPNAAMSTLNQLGPLSPSEAAIVLLRRNGKLKDYVEAETKAEREARERAEALRSIDPGGGRSVPGSRGKTFAIPFEEWAELTTAAKKRIRSMPENVVITGAPAHFDSNDTSLD